MDMVDHAQALEELDRAAALAAARAAPAAAASTLVCARCGDAIPAERRTAMPGATTCVDCQRRAEQKGR